MPPADPATPLPPLNLPAGITEKVIKLPAEGAPTFDPTKPETDHHAPLEAKCVSWEIGWGAAEVRISAAEQRVPMLGAVLGGKVLGALRDTDPVAYVRFASVYRSFRDIDEFAAELTRLKGP